MRTTQKRNSYYQAIKAFVRRLIYKNSISEIQKESKAPNYQNREKQDTANSKEGINEQKRANKIGIIYNKLTRQGNLIAVVSVIVGLLVFAATIAVFFLNLQAVNAAQKSANAADSAVVEQKRNDSNNLIATNKKNYSDSLIQRFKDSTDSIIRNETLVFYDSTTRVNQKTFELNKKANENSQAISRATLQQQINSLKETKDEFEKVKQAFLQFDNFSINDIIIDSQIVLRFDIKTLTEEPIYIDSLNIRLYYADSLNGLDSNIIKGHFVAIKKEFQFANTYVGGNSKLENVPFSPFPGMDKIHIEAVKNGNVKIYFAGVAKFKNLVTNEYRFYKFYIQMQIGALEKMPKNTDAYTFFYNRNEKN